MVSMGVAGATKASNVVTPSSLPLGNKSPWSRSVRVSNVFSVTSSTFSSVRVSNVFSSTSSKVSSKIVRGTPTVVNPTELSRYCKAKTTFGRSVTSIRAAAIAVGDKLPEATLCYIDSEKETNDISKVTISELTAGKKVILFAVPGAYMPTCSGEHLPGFVEKAEEFKAKGIDTIACISVNDIFVMKAWGDKLDVNGRVLLLSDEDGEYTKAIDSVLDFSDKPGGLGLRSRRYAMYVEDGVVKLFNLEVGGSLTFSSAEEILKSL